MDFDVAILFQRVEIAKGQYGNLIPADVVIGKLTYGYMDEFLKVPVPSIVGEQNGENCVFEAGIGFPISSKELIKNFISNEEITEEEFKDLIENYKLSVMNANTYVYHYEEDGLHIYCVNVIEGIIQEVDIFKSFYQNLSDLEQEETKVLLLEMPYDTGDYDE